MSEMSPKTASRLTTELDDLDAIAREVTSCNDLKNILLRVNSIQRVIFSEIERRNCSGMTNRKADSL